MAVQKFRGSAKNDRLSGSDLADALHGLGGHDTLRGLGGNDRLDGGTGNDYLIGGLGDDTYIVDSRLDKVIERAGEGIDTINASISYALAATVEILLLTGQAAIDGTGNSLANALTGNSGNNTLSGLLGDDNINGGAGNDILIGGRGRDTLTGGAGADIYRFFDGDLSSRTVAAADTIVDFQNGDKIDLSQVDALVAASEYFADGKQDFYFIGTNRFRIHSGREIRYEISDGDTLVYGSINGDNRTDFVLHLEGVHELVASDFLF